MDSESRDKAKKISFKRLGNAFKYSFEGLKYAYCKEQSMLIHIVILALALTGGFCLNINGTEWLFIILLMGFIAGLELINTSIEATIDLISPEIHPLAKIAKDTASAAVFILSMTGIVGAIVIFLPKILELFN